MTGLFKRFLLPAVVPFLGLVLICAPRPAFSQTPETPTREAVVAEGTHKSAADEASGTGEVLSPPQKGVVTAITTFVVFMGLIVILGKYAFGPIAAGLKKREDKIREELASADATLKKAQATLAEYNGRLAAAEGEVRKMLAQATADSEKIRNTLKATAESEAAEIRAKSRKDLEAATRSAIAQVHEEAVTLSTAIAAKILKRNINPEDQRSLVRESLQQVSSN